MADQILFDKLRYIDRLASAGIDRDQARAHAEAMEDALRESVATKSDIVGLENVTKSEIVRLENATKSDIAQLKTAIAELEQRLTVRMGMMATAVVAILAAIKFF